MFVPCVENRNIELLWTLGALLQNIYVVHLVHSLVLNCLPFSMASTARDRNAWTS